MSNFPTLGGLGEPAGRVCAQSKFSMLADEVRKALSHLNESVHQVKDQFAPVLVPGTPQPINETPPEPPSTSEFEGFISAVCSLIYKESDELKKLCERSVI